jgi:hypothetical protein
MSYYGFRPYLPVAKRRIDDVRLDLERRPVRQDRLAMEAAP